MHRYTNGALFGFMKIKNNQIKKMIDLLSKGHAALSYYLVLMKLKFSEKFLINEYLTDNGKLGGHPDGIKIRY